MIRVLIEFELQIILYEIIIYIDIYILGTVLFTCMGGRKFYSIQVINVFFSTHSMIR